MARRYIRDAYGRFAGYGGAGRAPSKRVVSAVRNTERNENIVLGGGVLNRRQRREVSTFVGFGVNTGALTRSQGKAIRSNFRAAQRRNAKAIAAGRRRQG